MEVQLGPGRGLLQVEASGEAPAVRRPIDPHILDAALDAEGVQPAVVVVGGAVAAVDRDVEQVRALDEAQVAELEGDLAPARGPAGHVVLEVGVGPVDAHPGGGEDPDAEDEVLHLRPRLPAEAKGHALTGSEYVALLAPGVDDEQPP